MHEFKESSAVIISEKKEVVSKDLKVFYNPAMELNRDLTIALLSSIPNKDMQIIDLLAGSGVRSIRMIKELPSDKIKYLAINDQSKDAVKSIKKHLKLNGLAEDKRIEIFSEDADAFLQDSMGFDYIDIDPFGSPAVFLNMAAKRLSRGGILAVTATDTQSLAGSAPKACRRRYASKPLKNEFMHETALRILAKKVLESATPHKKAFIPIYAYAKDHYYRIFFRCLKGKQKADKLFDNIGFLLSCGKCGFKKTTDSILNKHRCPLCNNNLSWAGPLWTGQLWDMRISKKIAHYFSTENSERSRFTATIAKESEINTFSFYDIHVLCRLHKIPSNKKSKEIIECLERKGHPAAQTHFGGQSIRTGAPFDVFLDALRS